MTDERVVRMLKERIVAIARMQIGAHYLRRGHGHTPGRPGADIYPAMPESAVFMRDNDPNRYPPIMYAAGSIMHGVHYVCAGCSGLYPPTTLPSTGGPVVRLRDYINDPRRQAERPEHSLWPRPDESLDRQGWVLGECCIGKVHFDCVGLVNWSYWKILGSPYFLGNNRISVPQWRNGVGGSPLIEVISQAQAEPGDLAFKGTHHIGIVSGHDHIIEAAGRHSGVLESALNPQWDAYGRPVRQFFAEFPNISPEELANTIL